MKSYEEVTNDLLERRDRYVARQKENRRKLTVLATSLGCFALVAALGLGLGQNASYSGQVPATNPRADILAGSPGETEPGTDPVPEQTAASTPAENEIVTPTVDISQITGDAHDICKHMGTLYIDGVLYLGWNPLWNPSGETDYTPGRYLGVVADFDGDYKPYGLELAAKLYASAEDPDVLLVVLENGDTLFLARNPSDLWP